MAACKQRSAARRLRFATSILKSRSITGTVADKAGGYAIQGLGGVFVSAIEGSYSGVVGLPVYEIAALLAGAGHPVLVPGHSHIEADDA